MIEMVNKQFYDFIQFSFLKKKNMDDSARMKMQHNKIYHGNEAGLKKFLLLVSLVSMEEKMYVFSFSLNQL